MMKKFCTASLLIFILIFLSACSTPLDRAATAIEAGDYDQALIEYDAALAEDLSPEDKFNAFEGRAMVYAQQGKTAEALNDYASALSITTDEGVPAGDIRAIYRSRTNILTREEEWLKAAAELDNLISLDSGNLELQIEKGGLLIKAESWAEVVSTMDQAIQISPTNAEALTLRGTAHLKLTNYEEAIDDLKSSLGDDIAAAKSNIDRRSNLAEAYYELGQVLYRLGEYRDAIDNFTESLKYVESDADTANTLAERGFANFEVDEYENALADINRAIKLDSSLAIAYSYRSYVYAIQEKYEEAILDADKAIELGADLPASTRSAMLHAKASALRNSGRLEEALAAATESIVIEGAASSEAARTYNMRSQINRLLGNFEDAYADADQAITIGAQDIPALPNFYSSRSRASFELDQLNQALEDQLAAIELGRKGAEEFEYLGDLYAYTGDFENAISSYDLAISLAPNDPLLHFYQGEIYLDSGDAVKALSKYQTAAELDPTEGVYYQSMADIYWSNSEFELAERNYKQAIAADPTNAWYYNSLGDVFYETDRFDLAEAEYLNAANRDSTIALFPENLGLARRLQDNFSGAIEAYSQALDIDAERAYSWYGRGYAYYLTNQDELAIPDLRQAKVFNLDQDFVDFVDELLAEMEG